MIKDIHEVLKGTGKWVDLHRFIKKHKHYNPSGLFELFGNFSSQGADEVRDCLMGWIYDNHSKFKTWLRTANIRNSL